MIGTFTDPLTARAFFRKRVKNMVLHMFRSLVTVVLKSHLRLRKTSEVLNKAVSIEEL